MATRNVVPIRRELSSVNPATGEVMRSYEMDSDAAVGAKLQRAAERFATWRATPFDHRSRLMQAAADILDREKQEWARLMTLEMGKTLRSAVQEVEKCARTCRFYAQNAERFLADEPTQGDGWQAGATATPTRVETWVRYQPLGPVLAVMPWNFPFWQLFRFAAPALMAGNVGLLKHASNVPQCALAIEGIFRRARFPKDVFKPC